MDRCFTLGELKKAFHPLSSVGLVVFSTLSAICALTAITIAGTEILQFVCYGPAGDKAPDWLKEEAFDDYGLKNGSQFPLYAFVLSEALPVILVTLVYLAFSKVLRPTPTSDASATCRCGMFRAYMGILLFRFLVLAIFMALQWTLFYPIIFPSEWDFTPMPAGKVAGSGYNHTRALNTTVAPSVYHCKNRAAVVKSTLNVVLFLVQCFVLLLAVTEVIYLWNRMGLFPDDIEFCRKYLKQELGNDNASSSRSPEDMELLEQGGPAVPSWQGVSAILKDEYLSRERTYVTPFPWLDHPWQLALDEIFIKVRMVGRDTQRFGELNKEEHGMYDIFEPNKHCKNPRFVLVEGAPGIGKTVFCQKLATDWSKGKTGGSFSNFRIVLNLKCRDIQPTCGELNVKALKESIADQLLPSDAPEELKTTLFEFMKIAPCETLVVLDGLDELKQAFDLDALKRQLRSWHCKFLFTSRNDPGLRQSCDSLYQIVGFTFEDAVAYIEKFFGEGGKDMATSLIGKIEKSRFLLDLVSNPLTTSLVCFVFHETDGQLPSSKAKLYRELTSCVLRRKYTRNGEEPPSQPLVVHEQDLANLGRMAFKGIETGQLHFSEAEFKDEGLATDVLHFGFLSQERSASKKMTNSPCCFQFVHKTIQEFFAALYLCNQLVSGNGGDWLANLAGKTEEELCRQYEQVLRFLVCMLSEKGERGKTAASGLFSSLARREARDNMDFGGFVCELVKECHDVNNNFGDAMVQPVVESWAVSWLHLPSRGLSEADVLFRVACSVVKANGPLEDLHLSNNELRDLAALADALRQNRRLERLWLEGNPQLTKTTIAALAATLTHHPAIEWLSLDKKFKEMRALKELERENPQLMIVFRGEWSSKCCGNAFCSVM